jgi:hypothetical protein
MSKVEVIIKNIQNIRGILDLFYMRVCVTNVLKAEMVRYCIYCGDGRR